MHLVPARVRDARRDALMSQEELAYRVGVSASTIRRLEGARPGKRRTDADLLARVARELDVELADLFADTDEVPA